MGGSISSTASLALTYCAYASASSLCNACLGSSSPATTGRRRSVLLLALASMLSLVFQYSLSPAILGDARPWWNAARKTGIGRRVYESWSDGCGAAYGGGGGGGDDGTTTTTTSDAAAFSQCAGNAGAYRPASASFLFFASASIASRADPSSNRKVWPAKYCAYLLMVFVSIFASNDPWFLGIFLHLSRAGALVFVVVQQVILIDLAYNWNDSWVGKADSADRLEWGSGAGWLRATIAVCSLFYALAFTGIGLLYHYFGGCRSNDAITTMTLLGIIAITALQLSGHEGSLLTSSVISLYAVYLGYSAVSKNPHGSCNPRLASESDPLGIAMGLLLTAVSLAWTGWSWTAEDRLGSSGGVTRARSLGRNSNGFRRGQDPLLDLDDPFLEHRDDDRPPSGLALSSDDADDYYYGGGEDVLLLHSSEVWKLNAILALVSCWVAMCLTGWGSISGGDMHEEGGVRYHTAANPQVGNVNMAMIAISQWVALSLYAWTLLAPRLFPDRDFS